LETGIIDRIVRIGGGWIVIKRASPAKANPWVLAACAVAIAGAALLHRPARSQQYVPTDPPEHPRLSYGGSLITLNDRCPVRQAKLNPTYKAVYVNRRPVAFCCMMCPGVFVQNPEPYLALQTPAQPSKMEEAGRRLSPRYRIGLRSTTFQPRGDGSTKKDRLRYCGELTDPMTMVRFRPAASSPHTKYENRWYYFASDSSLAQFLAKPEQHKDRRNGMN
jgi:YHS domain-containing protein